MKDENKPPKSRFLATLSLWVYLFFMHVFYYGNEMLDKNSLEWRVYTGKEKTSGSACGPYINSVIDFWKKKRKKEKTLKNKKETKASFLLWFQMSKVSSINISKCKPNHSWWLIYKDANLPSRKCEQNMERMNKSRWAVRCGERWRWLHHSSPSYHLVAPPVPLQIANCICRWCWGWLLLATQPPAQLSIIYQAEICRVFPLLSLSYSYLHEVAVQSLFYTYIHVKPLIHLKIFWPWCFIYSCVCDGVSCIFAIQSLFVTHWPLRPAV